MQSNEKSIKGFKVTNAEMQCRGFQYEINKSYTHSGGVSLCNKGFHFCLKATHCFNYYDFDSSNRVFEIEASGTVSHGDDKSVASEIKFIREIPWAEVLTIVNVGANNTGRSNTGDSNTGDSNTGDSNTGNSNTGDSNTGDWNTGDWNTGYSNTGNRNTGAFCAGEAPFFLFNRPCKMTEQEFRYSRAYSLLCQVDTKMWVSPGAMTDAEKDANPSYKIRDGYLRDIPFKEAFQAAWHNWNAASHKVFTSLENFDAEIFKTITGVDAAAQEGATNA